MQLCLTTRQYVLDWLVASVSQQVRPLPHLSVSTSPPRVSNFDIGKVFPFFLPLLPLNSSPFACSPSSCCCPHSFIKSRLPLNWLAAFLARNRNTTSSTTSIIFLFWFFQFATVSPFLKKKLILVYQ